MQKTILYYGLSLAGLAFLLKFLEYRFLISDFSIELYIGAAALIFMLLGAWAGQKLIARGKINEVKPAPFKAGSEVLQKSGISSREYEVLALMAAGYSNQEIADKLFVSLNTVKTHSVNIYGKLDVKRRTQAVQKAKELKLLP